VLKVTASITASGAILDLEGKLAGPWVGELKECWRSVAASGVRVRVMLCAVTFIDEAGKRLLVEMHRQGAELIAEGCMNTAIVAEIEEEKGKF
jgi:anti-anti-sigma regulatory factor